MSDQSPVIYVIVNNMDVASPCHALLVQCPLDRLPGCPSAGTYIHFYRKHISTAVAYASPTNLSLPSDRGDPYDHLVNSVRIEIPQPHCYKSHGGSTSQ